MARRSWALNVVDDCAAMSKEAQQRYTELEVITRAVDAAVMNLEKHVKALDLKNADIQIWAANIQKEQESSGSDWEASMARLRAVPATNEMIKFVTGRDLRKNQRRPTLEDLVCIFLESLHPKSDVSRVMRHWLFTSNSRSHVGH